LASQVSVRVKQSEHTANSIDQLSRRKFIDPEFQLTNFNAGVPESEKVDWLPLTTLAQAAGYQHPCYSVMAADLRKTDNGHGDPNIRDAVYFLSFARSPSL